MQAVDRTGQPYDGPVGSRKTLPQLLRFGLLPCFLHTENRIPVDSFDQATGQSPGPAFRQQPLFLNASVGGRKLPEHLH